MITIVWFVLFTGLYAGIAIALMYGELRWFKKQNHEEAKEKLILRLRNNNTWFVFGLVCTFVTFVIACFHFGPALLLPENFPTREQRGTLGNFLSHLLHGVNAPAKSIPSSKLPWATGTWFWWKAFFLFAVLTFIYFWYAFSDEFKELVEKIQEVIKKHHDKALEKMQLKHQERLAEIRANMGRGRGGGNEPLPQAPPTKLRFWEFAKFDLLVEIGEVVLKSLITKWGKA